MQSRTSLLRALMLGVAITASFLLSGCVATEPDSIPAPLPSQESSPTPNLATPRSEDPPIITAPPRSEEEAVDIALGVIYVYFTVEAELVNEDPEDTSKIELIASGSAAQNLEDTAASAAASPAQRQGRYTFEPDESYTAVTPSDSGAFGTVDLLGCLNGTQLSGINAYGEYVASLPDHIRPMTFRVEQMVDGTWLVTGVGFLPEDEYPCRAS